MHLVSSPLDSSQSHRFAIVRTSRLKVHPKIFCLSDSLLVHSFRFISARSNAPPCNRLPIPRLRIGFMSISLSW